MCLLSCFTPSPPQAFKVSLSALSGGVCIPVPLCSITPKVPPRRCIHFCLGKATDWKEKALAVLRYSVFQDCNRSKKQTKPNLVQRPFPTVVSRQNYTWFTSAKPSKRKLHNWVRNCALGRKGAIPSLLSFKKTLRKFLYNLSFNRSQIILRCYHQTGLVKGNYSPPHKRRCWEEVTDRVTKALYHTRLWSVHLEEINWHYSVNSVQAKSPINPT